MSVRVRLGLAFVVVMVLFLIPIRYAEVQLNDLREMAVDRRSQHAAATLALGTFGAGTAEYDRQQRAYLATLDTAVDREVEAAIADLRTQVVRMGSAGYQDATRGLAAELDSLTALSAEIDRLIRADSVERATRRFGQVGEVRSRMTAEREAIAAEVDERSQADFDRAEQMSATAAATTLGGTLVAALLALAVGFWTTGALTTPLQRLSRAAARVEGGTFETPEDLPYDRPDEIGDLSRSFRAMTERLAELDRLKAEFMSVASHELKTPISVVRAYAEVIEQGLGDEITERQRKGIDAIIGQTDVMVRLLNRLLNIGRLEAGTYRLEIETVGVDDVLADLERSFDVLARQQGIRLVTESLPDAPDTVDVDADLLKNEVLGNLLSNALRFTPDDGEVRLRVWREDDVAVFEVSDTGPGVPEEKRPHIFEKYYEGGRTRFMGAGLGLAVAKEVTEVHGGRITLEPPADRGATFRVYVPVTQDVQETA